jgi:ABC-type transport system involved in cytochrome bd biosynthesis fused ATPase/permease subunit
MNKIFSRVKELQRLRENVHAAAKRMTEGRATVIQFGREAYENTRLKVALDEYSEAAADFALKAAFAAAFFILALFLSVTAAIIATGALLIDGNITQSGAVAITVIVFAAFAALGIAAFLKLKKNCKPSSQIDTAPIKTPITYGNLDKATERNDLNFSGVSFSYTEREIFSGLSFYIKSGEPFAVLGRTGSGKSTLQSILRREIEPDAGIITIGGIEIEDFEEKLFGERLKSLDFITSNRVSEVMNRETIILLEDGIASAVGNHRTLLVTSPLYRKMYEAEFGVNPYESLDKGEKFDDFI